MLMTERIITAFLIEQQKQRQQEADALKGKRVPGQPSRKGKKFGMKLAGWIGTKFIRVGEKMLGYSGYDMFCQKPDAVWKTRTDEVICDHYQV
jgi:hypothetical protein